jgi:hypothetical protein
MRNGVNIIKSTASFHKPKYLKGRGVFTTQKFHEYSMTPSYKLKHKGL